MTRPTATHKASGTPRLTPDELLNLTSTLSFEVLMTKSGMLMETDGATQIFWATHDHLQAAYDHIEQARVALHAAVEARMQAGIFPTYSRSKEQS